MGGAGAGVSLGHPHDNPVRHSDVVVLMLECAGDLSGLTETQLRQYLIEVRRIAVLDDAAALLEVDTMAWGVSEIIAAAAGGRPDAGDRLSHGREAGAP